MAMCMQAWRQLPAVWSSGKAAGGQPLRAPLLLGLHSPGQAGLPQLPPTLPHAACLSGCPPGKQPQPQVGCASGCHRMAASLHTEGVQLLLQCDRHLFVAQCSTV